MSDQMKPASEERFATKEPASTLLAETSPFALRALFRRRSGATFPYWSVGALLLGGGILAARGALWWKLHGIIQPISLYDDGVGNLLLPLHALAVVIGVLLTILGTSSAYRQGLSVLAFLWTIAVFMAGLVFLKYGWIRILPLG